MDSYKKLIKYMFSELKKLKASIELSQGDLQKKDDYIKDLQNKYEIIKDEYELKTEHLDIVKNYESIMSNKVESLIWDWGWKSVLITLVCRGITAIFSTILSYSLMGTLSIISAVVLIIVNSVKYLKFRGENKAIKDRYEEKYLENYVNELENHRDLLYSQILSETDKKQVLSDTINSMMDQGNFWVNQMNFVNEKRNSAIEEIVKINEQKINAQYTNDEEVLKLERKFKDGKNV